MGVFYKKLLSFPLALVLLCSLLPPGLAAPAPTRVVRVAYPEQYGITQVDEAGRRSGYTYEYLEEIAQYTGWDYEFVQLPGSLNESLSMAMEMVRTGQIDLMGATLYQESMAKDYLYTSQSYGSVETVLQTPYGFNSAETLGSRLPASPRVAVLALKGRRIEELNAYCAMNNITPEYILCSSDAEQLQAILEGRADLLLNTSFNHLENVRTMASFAPKPFYFITGSGSDPGLINDLSAAMLELELANPTFLSSLYDKYFSAAPSGVSLSESEVRYLKQLDCLTVGFLSAQAPFQYVDDDGAPAGIAIDLISLIADRLEIPVKFIRADTQDELNDLIVNSQVQMAASLPYNYDLARAKGLAMTQPYVSTQYILVSRSDIGEISSEKRLAITPNSIYEDKVLGQAVYRPTAEDCITAVADGDADYTYVDAYTAQFFLNSPRYRSLKLSPQTYESRKSCFGIPREAPKELLSLLNKSLLSLDEVTLQGIFNQNTLSPQTSYTLFDMILEYPVQFLGTIGGVSLLIILILLYFLRQRAAMNRRNALELKKHYQVYALLNEHFFEYSYRENSILLSNPASQKSPASSHLLHDFLDPPADSSHAERRAVFLDFIRTHQSGVHEVEMLCSDGQNHWLRLAIETVFDGGHPAYALGKINVIDDERQEKQVLLEKATLDSLTHLYNVETVRGLVTRSMQAMPPAATGALLLVDVDNFKAINDTYGHLEGDATLLKIAGLLRENFRSTDILGRPGGDEFFIFIPTIRSREALQNRCTALCSSVRAVTVADGTPVTISLGGVLTHAQDTYDQVYELADQALYAAKAKGRNQFILTFR